VTQNSRPLLLRWLGDRIFYGWVIVAAASINLVILFGIRNSFGVFLKSLEAEFELTRGAISSVFSVYMALTAIFVFISGWVLDKYGPRLVVSIMGAVTGLSLLITSQTTSFWQLLLGYSVLMSIGTGGARSVLVSVVSRWFYRKRGFALGIATSGIGLGTLGVVPFAAYLISHQGWRMSCVTLGLVAWFVVISLAMLLRKDPGQIGSLPDGVKSTAAERELLNKQKDSSMTGLSLTQAMGTRSFWLLLTIFFMNSLNITQIITHIVPYATDIGISNLKASTVITVIGCFHIISRLSIGRISDVIGRKMPAVASAVLCSLAMLWLVWLHDLRMLYLFAALFGLAWGGCGVTVLAMVSDAFGERKIGTLMGALDVGLAVGGAVGATLAGLIFDITNSYAASFIIGSASMLVSAVCYSLIRRETGRVTEPNR